MMDKMAVQENLVKEVLQEVEKLSSQFSQGKVLITNAKQAQEIIWKIYYNIWQNNFQYNSVITLGELKEIHQGYNQKILANQKPKN